MPDSTRTRLDLNRLRTLVAGDAVAIRATATLEPAGGPGDKVFPPSHSVDANTREVGAKYAFERRRIAGRDVECVLLDSVQSQANRMEEALEALWFDKSISLPVIKVDFSECAPDVRVVTSLSAPHRVADAILRDSLDGDVPFRMSDLGRSFADASTKNAAPLFKVCPTGLVFGLWDSTGPRGGSGAKFARAIVSEIVGHDAQRGVKTSSRIDPLGIVTSAGPILLAREPALDGTPTWTLDVFEAKLTKEGKPPKDAEDVAAVEKWGKKEKAGKPTAINHSNIPPSIDILAGGVTIEAAAHIAVLSLAGLRKLNFGGDDDEARTTLAALGLLALLAASRRGHDLRSRCLLVPRAGEGLTFEAVAGDGTVLPLDVDYASALALYKEAVAALPEALRFPAPGEPLATLKPSPKLALLVKRSRELAAKGADAEEA